MTTERPSPKLPQYGGAWICVLISAITIIGMLWTKFTIGGSDTSGWLIVILCNLPLAFMSAAYPVKRAHEMIQSLENRVRELEAKLGAK